MNNKNGSSSNGIIDEVSSYISKSAEAELPAEVVAKAKHHILDTLAAIISGSRLKPGELARYYAESQPRAEEAQVAGSQVTTSAIGAAFANGMMAHADETDDSHAKSFTHPGCAIVPAALSVSEREGVDGMSFLRGVVAGYDIGCRITQVLGARDSRQRSHSTHSIGGGFGAAAAAAAVLRLKDNQVRYVLSYAAQQASGVKYWVRDSEHVEKAFVFGGMPARNGATAATLVQAGFTGVWDPLSGEHNFLQAFSPSPNPEVFAAGLGSHYEIMFTNIKKFSVGSPIQAALDALFKLMIEHRLTVSDVQSIVVRIPEPSAKTVNSRDMPDINVQHILAVALVDGALTFEAAHSYQRMSDPAILRTRSLVTLIEDVQLSPAVRQAVVEVNTTDGAKLSEHASRVRGTADNPMSTAEVETKCRDLLMPVLGPERSQRLIDKVWDLERVANVRELRPLLSA